MFHGGDRMGNRSPMPGPMAWVQSYRGLLDEIMDWAAQGE